MSISSIGSSSSYLSQLSTLRNRSASSETEKSSSKEKPGLAELFSKLDTDGSGSLEQTEVQSLTEKISEATGVSVDLAEFLTTYDTDADGALSEDEAVTALEANRPQGPPPEGMMVGMGAMQGSGGPDYAQMFSEMDTDGDSSISATEAESLADIIGNATGTTIKADDLVTAYDADGDGALSAEETATALEANRPAGPTSPPGSMTAAAEDSDAATSAAIDRYLKMAALGMEQDQAVEDIFSILAGSDSSVDSIA